LIMDFQYFTFIIFISPILKIVIPLLPHSVHPLLLK